MEGYDDGKGRGLRSNAVQVQDARPARPWQPTTKLAAGGDKVRIAQEEEPNTTVMRQGVPM